MDEINHDSPYAEKDDRYIGVKVPLPHSDGEMKQATIKRRKRNENGTLRGTSHDNPILDTRVYEVEFEDGSYNEYSANVLAENLYSHIDENGNSHSILASIVDHEVDLSIAVHKDDSYYEVNNTRKRRITTKGWKFKVEWKDGSHSWVPLKIIKESNPIELAEYAISRDIQGEAAFAWWVPYVIRKRNRIIKMTEHRNVKSKMKFGVEVP